MSEDIESTLVPTVPATGLVARPTEAREVRRSVKALRRAGEAIHDDAKRSVSFRISTSDYGRIKVAARHFRMRESELFRYLVGVGTSRLIRVLEGAVASGARYHLLVRMAVEWRRELGLAAVEAAALIGCMGGGPPLVLDAADLLLVDLAASRPTEAAALLDLQLGEQVGERCVLERLGDYFALKYERTPTSDG